MAKKPIVWVIDDDDSIRWVLEKGLTEGNLEVVTFDRANKAIKRLETDSPDVILTDIKMPGASGIQLLDFIKENRPEIPVIIMTAHSDLESAVESYEHGAWEYLPKPFDIEQAINIIKRSIEEESINVNDSDLKTAEIIGEAPAMQEVFRAIGKLSNSNSTVLLIGESGTGKELVSKALFQHSPRKDKPFLALNMADIPKELLESELFGHEKGSFTGAIAVCVFVSPWAVSFNKSFKAVLLVKFLGVNCLPIIFSLKEFFTVSGTSTILSLCSTIVGFNSSRKSSFNDLISLRNA